MIFRPISLLTFGLAAFAGLHLYQTKHEVALLDRELRGIARGIEEAQSRTQALQAEWAWLNEPERLRGVAQRHLQLEPITPAQFIRLNEADRRLPAATAYAGPTALFAERPPVVPAGPVQLALLPRVPEPVQVVVARAVAAPPAAPAPVAAVPAAITPEPAAPAAPVALALPAAPPRPATPPAAPAPVAAPAPRPAEPRPAPVEVARLASPPRPVVPTAAAAPRPAPRQAPEVAALPPVAAPVRATLAPAVAHAAPPPAPALRPAVTQVATAAPAVPRPADPPAVALGSALGGGRSMLPPPVPFGSANASTLTGAGLR